MANAKVLVFCRMNLSFKLIDEVGSFDEKQSLTVLIQSLAIVFVSWARVAVQQAFL